MPPTPGTRLGPYEVVGPIGAGGMGEVYRARDAKLNRFVALKVLHGHFAADPDRLARFEREAQAVAALSHPGILAIHDFGSAGGVTYAVMELLEGGTLRERLDSGPDGRMLFISDTSFRQIDFYAPDQDQPRDFSLFEQGTANAISSDGRAVLITDQGDLTTWLRRVDRRISHARRTIVPAYVLTAVVQSLRRGRDQVRRW